MQSLSYYNKNIALYLIEDCVTKKQVIIFQSDFKKYFHQEITMTTEQKLYTSLFRGRKDVYAKSYINEMGKTQYYPSYNYGWRQLPVDNRTCQPLTEQVLKSHLRGENSIGIFPIHKNDTCYFLVIDLDDEDFREAALSILATAIFPSLELSRSGNGVHIWFFFEEEIECREARNFWKKLLELTLQSSDQLTFSSFDRLFPNQDVLPKGGFGNLIALPLQGKS